MKIIPGFAFAGVNEIQRGKNHVWLNDEKNKQQVMDFFEETELVVGE